MLNLYCFLLFEHPYSSVSSGLQKLMNMKDYVKHI